MPFWYTLPVWFWSLILFLVSLLLVFKNKVSHVETLEGEQRLPPGPPKLPIIGNLHLLGNLPHQSLWKLSKKYGPVMLLHLGRIPTVVISSAEAAKEVLRVKDLACCSRPLLAGTRRITYNYLDVAFSPYGEHWRDMKKLTVLELFSLKRVLSFRHIREQEVDLMLSSISKSAASEAPDNLTDKLFALNASVTFRMSFGFNYRGTGFAQNKFHEVVHDVSAVAGSISAVEMFPCVGWILDRLLGIHARTERVFHEIDTFFQHVIDDHLKPGRIKQQDDMIDVMLGMLKEEAEPGAVPFTIDNVKGVLLNLFLGGVDTGAITLNWAMTELVRNPRVMNKAQEEVRNCLGKKEKVTESDLDQLQYLKLVIKETLRLHPPAPLLIPRETMSPFKINGLNIRPKSLLIINGWGIGRDPKYWKDPEEFSPERFADSSIDFKGQHFEFLPFGAGRRICPGINMGMATVEIALANLLYCFDWKLPVGMNKDDVSLDEKTGLSLTVDTKAPLRLIPIRYIP